MTPDQMRRAIRTVYGMQWRAKVDKMSDAQVVAVYLKFKSQNKI